MESLAIGVIIFSLFAVAALALSIYNVVTKSDSDPNILPTQAVPTPTPTPTPSGGNFTIPEYSLPSNDWVPGLLLGTSSASVTNERLTDFEIVQTLFNSINGFVLKYTGQVTKVFNVTLTTNELEVTWDNTNPIQFYIQDNIFTVGESNAPLLLEATVNLEPEELLYFKYGDIAAVGPTPNLSNFIQPPKVSLDFSISEISF
jgi:hypothetical protein